VSHVVFVVGQGELRADGRNARQGLITRPRKELQKHLQQQHKPIIIIIITRVSGQVHCAYSCKSTLVQDKQDTTRRPVI
jgi:hypothetical protein